MWPFKKKIEESPRPVRPEVPLYDKIIDMRDDMLHNDYLPSKLYLSESMLQQLSSEYDELEIWRYEDMKYDCEFEDLLPEYQGSKVNIEYSDRLFDMLIVEGEFSIQ